MPIEKEQFPSLQTRFTVLAARDTSCVATLTKITTPGILLYLGNVTLRGKSMRKPAYIMLHRGISPFA